MELRIGVIANLSQHASVCGDVSNRKVDVELDIEEGAPVHICSHGCPRTGPQSKSAVGIQVGLSTVLQSSELRSRAPEAASRAP